MGDWQEGLRQRIREHAYKIWEDRGRPDGEHERHWFEAERAVKGGNSHEDRGGLKAARDYNRDLNNFEKSGQVDSKAEEAKRAVEGPERDSLKRAEEQGKQRGRGDDTGGKR